APRADGDLAQARADRRDGHARPRRGDHAVGPRRRAVVAAEPRAARRTDRHPASARRVHASRERTLPCAFQADLERAGTAVPRGRLMTPGSHDAYLAAERRAASRRRIRITGWQIGILAALLGAWELLTR